MYEHEFEFLGETVQVRTDKIGSFLNVRFGDVMIEESSGSCFDWDYTGLLHGAALKANENRQLKDAGLMAIKSRLMNLNEDIE